MAACNEFTQALPIPECTDTLEICADPGVGTWYVWLMDLTTGRTQRFTGSVNGDSNLEIDTSSYKFNPESTYRVWVNINTEQSYTRKQSVNSLDSPAVSVDALEFNVERIRDNAGAFITGTTAELRTT